MNKDIKVIHIITRLDKGGSSENTLHTCIGLRKKGFNVKIIYGKTINENTNLIEEAKQEGVNFIYLKYLVRDIHPFLDLLSLIKLYIILRKERPQIVHLHSSKAGVLGRLCCFLLKVPIVIYSPHGHVFYGYFNKFFTKVIIYAEKILSCLCDMIILLTSQSRFEWVYVFKIAPLHKTFVVPSGLDLERMKVSGNMEELRRKFGFPINKIIVGNCSRFVPIKGQKFILEAVPFVVNKRKDVLFVIAGEGPLEEDLKKIVERLKIHNYVKFLPWQENPSEFIKSLDIFVHYPLNEGMGRVLIEAFYQERLVIASNVGGIPSLVDTNTGFLVEPQNPYKLADIILYAINHKDRLRYKIQEAKKRVLFFTKEMMIKRTLYVYKYLLRRKNIL